VLKLKALLAQLGGKCGLAGVSHPELNWPQAGRLQALAVARHLVSGGLGLVHGYSSKGRGCMLPGPCVGSSYLSDFSVARNFPNLRVCQIYEGTSEMQKILIGRVLA
jgi:alkylation response protein AidB-like acyl-CoA dehydrogenase